MPRTIGVARAVSAGLCVCVCGAAVECGFTERNETGFFWSRLGNLFNLIF